MKKKYGRGLDPGDISLHGKNLFWLVLFSCIGGFVSGALGLGGGSIFNPLLLSMGMPPKVASASGMYMIIFACAASSTTYIIAGMLKVHYALWIGTFNIVGTVCGMIALKMLMKKIDRQSPLVFLLVAIFILSTICVPIFGY